MATIKISEIQKREIITRIIRNPMFLGNYRDEDGGIITFLEMIWDLRSMPSEDRRYTNAREDIWKHIVLNDDITIEELFLDRLPSSYTDEKKFIAIINATIHPSVMHEEAKRNKLVDFISTLLIKYGYQLIITDYFGETPVYTFAPLTNKFALPKGIKPNNIIIYKSSYERKKYPCFILEFNKVWNDWFKWNTSFHISYWESEQSNTAIGYLKIMKEDANNTNDVIPDNFTILDSSFCSLGINREFYLTMKKTLPHNYHSVFLALRDVAIFPSIKDKFEDNECFKNSLLRDNEPKQLLDSARYIMNNIDVSSYYKFSYSFLPPYSPQDLDFTINIDFDFKYGTDFDQRIYALIGKNGTGKTTLLSKIANDFAKANSKNIIPQKPLYNKIITISFSFFDKLPLPTANALFNYTYLGLKGKNEELDTDVDTILKKALIKHLNTINKKRRFHIWNNIVGNLFHKDIKNKIINKNISAPIEIDNILNIHANSSSGENLLLYIVSSILGEIQNNTLILFDEPESHLHPNAISTLMNTLYNLLNEFNSFAIIATHSPIVIQEVSSSNIKVFKRDNNILNICNIGYETFAENLSTITDEIFDNREIAQYHRSTIENIVNSKSKGTTYEELIKIFQNKEIPTSLNLKLYLKELLNEKSKTI